MPAKRRIKIYECSDCKSGLILSQGNTMRRNEPVLVCPTCDFAPLGKQSRSRKR